MSDYNWNEILKNKTDKELYSISLGMTHVPENVVDLAKNELIKRGITDSTIEKHKNKWELKNLIEEENKQSYWKISSKMSWILTSIMTIVTLVAGLLDLFHIINIKSNSTDPPSTILLFASLFCAIMTIVWYKKYQKSKRNEKKMNDLIEDL